MTKQFKKQVKNVAGGLANVEVTTRVKPDWSTPNADIELELRAWQPKPSTLSQSMFLSQADTDKVAEAATDACTSKARTKIANKLIKATNNKAELAKLAATLLARLDDQQLIETLAKDLGKRATVRGAKAQ